MSYYHKFGFGNPVSIKNVNVNVNKIISCIPFMTLEQINKITCVTELRKLEQTYDDFLQKKIQILLLYNMIEEIDTYLDIRDSLIIRRLKVELEKTRIKLLRYRFNCFY
jgi:hypothetical protein